jgi:glycosyltransferase involved in cell wall biosynthesis
VGPACGLLTDAQIPFQIDTLPVFKRSLGLASIIGTGAAVIHATSSLRRIVDSFSPTIIYSNTSHVLAGPALATYAGVPHIWHLREIERASNRVRRAWGALLLHTGTVIAISRSVARNAFSEHIIRSELDRSLHVVPDGIDLNDFPYHVPQVLPEPTILLPGRFTPWKGQLQAVRAMEILTRPGLLKIVGNPTTQQDERWVREILEPEAARSHRATVNESTDDLGRLYDGAQFVLQSSLKPEPFGRTVIEGMARGLIPIVPDQGGPAEIVRPNVDAFMYRTGDIRSMAATIDVALSTTNEQIRRMSAAGRNRVAASFTAERNASRILDSVITAIRHRHGQEQT